MIVTVEPNDVRIGMYVVSFEGGWLSHPFWRRSFVLTSQKDVERIVEAGIPVRVDTSKGSGVPPVAKPPDDRECEQPSRAASQQRPISIRRSNAKLPSFGRANEVRAIELAKRSKAVVKAMFEECRLGGDVPIQQLLAVVDDISHALEHESSTFIAVTRLRAKDDYTYTHSIAVCALMISLARQIGYSLDQARDLGMAGLLHDLGKLRVPDDVLRKPGSLTLEETAQMRRHPEYGHDMLLTSQGVPAVILDVCLHHHERLDGSGYPFGLKGEAISEAVRIGTICDVYDAITSTRPYKKGLFPGEAIEQLAMTTGHFDENLLFQLMIGVGNYPARTLVRLRSNRLAMALPLKKRSARTEFRTFYSTIDTQFTAYEDIVPGDTLDNDRPVSREDPAAWFSVDWPAMANRIARRLPPLLGGSVDGTAGDQQPRDLH